MPEVVLPGCTPEPLMSYLKALGVFRLVAEQAEPAAKLSWVGNAAQLTSGLDRSGLTAFFTSLYKPTPILAPWNGGSGFYGGGSEPLDAISNENGERFAPYREAIRLIRTIIPKAKPKDDDKADLLAACRNILSDDMISWLDVCFVLGEDGPSFFPLLGTGGNDGRLDFTNNFMQRVAEVVQIGKAQPAEQSEAFLAAALFADALVALGKSAIGQFNPGGIGGANGIQGKFEADSLVNPWDFVLMIEGTLLFAGSVARRLGTSSNPRAAFPFTVDSVAVGYGSACASEETADGSRAELWLPLWTGPATLAEVRQLFAEGRAQLGRKQAKNAVEFALAANLLGVNRGVHSFTRFGFLKRNGLAFIAAPLGRTKVQLRPMARLLEDPPLSEWVDRLRSACRDKDKTPTRYQSALRQIDRAMFAFANRSERGNDQRYLVDVLVALGRAERTLSNGLAFCKDKYLRPLSGLDVRWLSQADDCSVEYRLAASLAGIGKTLKGELGPLRVFIEPVEVTGYINWMPGSTSAVWSAGPLSGNLAAVFRRRQMEAFAMGGAGVRSRSLRPASLNDVTAFLNHEVDEEKLHDLIWGLIGVEYPKEFAASEGREADIPFEFGVPRLLVQENSLSFAKGCWRLSDSEVNVKPDPDVFHELASGRADAVDKCATRAARRLKSGGLLVNGYRNRRQAGKQLAVSSSIDPERLLAAMLFPLSDGDLERIANSVLYPPESES